MKFTLAMLVLVGCSSHKDFPPLQEADAKVWEDAHVYKDAPIDAPAVAPLCTRTCTNATTFLQDGNEHSELHIVCASDADNGATINATYFAPAQGSAASEMKGITFVLTCLPNCQGANNFPAPFPADRLLSAIEISSTGFDVTCTTPQN